MFNEKLAFYRQDKRLLKTQYDKEILLNLYDKMLIFNFNKIFEMGKYAHFALKTINELKLENEEAPMILDFTKNTHNSYIKDMNDRMELSKDILTNGYYLPVFVRNDPNKGLIVDSGKHRVCSMQLYNAKNNWNSLIPVIETIETLNVMKTKENYLNEKLSEPIRLRLPIEVLFTKDYEKCSEDYINECLTKINGIFVEKNIIEFNVTTVHEFFRVLLIANYWLTEAFYINYKETGVRIKGHKLFNQVDIFVKYINKEISYEEVTNRNS